MAELEPHEALLACERALRHLYAHAYEGAYGTNWLTTVAGERQVEAWIERRAVEQRKRTTPGVVEVSDDLLADAHFYDLLAIAGKHWAPLAGALGKKAESLTLLQRFDRLRDTIAHSRQLLGFEMDLLSGIPGQIRTK
jgi:hypothetical protein